jgi:hypothetical protein
MTNNTAANGDALVLQCNDNSNFKPHAPGIWPVVCIDIIDLGLVWTEFQGKRKLVRKLKFVFESEVVGEDGKRGIITKNFSASVHPKSNLAGFLGKWRGRPVVPGENIDLKKVIGASATLVVSHQQNMAGKTYASIDAVSKPTKKVTPSGTYDPAAMRQRIAEWAAKDAAGQPPIPQQAAPAPQPAPAPAAVAPATVDTSKSAAAPAATDGKPYPEFDAEVGF